MSAIAARAFGGPAKPSLKLRIGVVAGGLLFGALAGYLGSSGSITRVFALCAVFLPVVLWKRPYLAPAILLSAAVLFEQTIQFPHIPITENIPMFTGLVLVTSRARTSCSSWC